MRESSAVYWLWLSSLTEVNLNAKAALLEVFGNPEAAFHAPKGFYAGIEGISARDAEALEARDLTEALQIPELCEKEGIAFLTLEDARYPQRLKEIYAPPAVLYVKGRLPDLDREVPVAVIGTRHASPYGIKMARNIAYELSRCGAVVVSGLTQGCDAAAAEGTLAAGGVCIGVLGTPISARSSLPSRVCRQGALISEYAPCCRGTRKKRDAPFCGGSSGAGKGSFRCSGQCRQRKRPGDHPIPPGGGTACDARVGRCRRPGCIISGSTECFQPGNFPAVSGIGNSSFFCRFEREKHFEKRRQKGG